jgi:hypothetical protein
MFGSVLVDVAVGLVLLYLMVALFCTAIQEWIAQLFDLRAKHLQAAIRILLSGTEQSNTDADAVLKHPIVKMLGIDARMSGPGPPSYIPSRNFAEALVALLAPADGQPLDLPKLRAGVDKLQNAEVKKSLEAILDRAQGIANQSKDQVRLSLRGIEIWYDSAMDHASGWYKRKVRWFLLAISAVIAILANADSVQVGLRLASDAELRKNIAALGARTAPPDAAAEPALAEMQKQIAAQLAERNMTGVFGSLPVGWGACQKPDTDAFNFGTCYRNDQMNQGLGALLKLLGLALTAIAASLGAPFWFGLLQQLNAIRATGPKPVSATAGDSD